MERDLGAAPDFRDVPDDWQATAKTAMPAWISCTMRSPSGRATTWSMAAPDQAPACSLTPSDVTDNETGTVAVSARARAMA